MKFSDEEQAYIQELIDKAYQRAYSKATESAATARTAELEDLLLKAREKNRDAELKAAAARHGAYHPADVVFLLKDAVKIAEDGELHVIGKDGARRYDREGSPLTIEGAVADFLSENTHFVKARPSPGSGGSFFGGIFGK